MTKKRTVEEQPTIIAHISDLHAGSQYFIPNLLARTVEEINELNPQIVIATGDLTDAGFRQEYKTAKNFIDMLECDRLIIVPGNHDSRNVGYVHFEELFGKRNQEYRLPGITIIGIDSSEPDLDNGHVGRERYRWIEERFLDSEGVRIFALHHHLLPVPGTGRERNIVYDAGDLLEVLVRCNVDLVLNGHKHVPHVWRLENLVCVTAGTASSLRLRGRTKPCYNLIYLQKDRIKVYRKYPFGGRELIVDLLLSEKVVCKWDRVITELGNP